MKRLLFSIMIILGIGLEALSQNQNPCWVGFENTQAQGYTVNFTGYSSSDSSGYYSWSFGDGSSGAGRNISHTYTAPGSYNVCVSYRKSISQSPDTCRSNFCKNIAVQNCSINTSFTNTAIGSAVNFFGSASLSGGFYRWNFGDGTFGLGQNVNHQYTTSGNYTVCLTYERSNPNYPFDTCKASFCKVVNVVTQGCNLSTTFTTDTVGSAVNFSGSASTSGGIYRWNFGDGSYAFGQNVSYQYPTSGNYFVCLSYERANPNYPFDTCKTTFCDTINVFVPNCNIWANFTTSQNGDSVNFFGTATASGGTYSWDFGDGTGGIGQNQSHRYAASGNYFVSLAYEKINPNYPFDTCKTGFGNTISVTVHQCDLTANFTSTETGSAHAFFGNSSSPGGIYFWEFGDGTTAVGQNVNHQYAASGNYVACLRYERINPNYPHDTCRAIYCDSIKVQLPPCNISTSFITTQRGSSINFNATGTPAPYSFYTWNFGDGTTGYGQSVNHIYPGVGTYTACVTYTSINPNFPHDTCKAVSCDTITITRMDCNVSTSFTTTQSGDTVNFSATGTPAPYTFYTWYFGDGTTGHGQYVSHVYPHEGTFNFCVTYTSINPNFPHDTCEAVSCGNIVIEKGGCNISTRIFTTQRGSSINFYAAGTPASNTHYTWNFGDGTTGYGQSVNHVYPGVGTYVACVTYTSINPDFPHDTCEAVSCDTITITRTDCNVSTSFTTTQSGDTVNFSATGTPAPYTFYTWYFGDGTTAHGQNVNHLYPDAGTYIACVVYTNINPNFPHDTCDASFCDTITVDRTDCNISTSFITTQRGSSINFNATGTPAPYSFYTWNFGDGTTGYGQSVNHVYPGVGTYTACVTYTSINPNFPHDTCEAVSCDTIIIDRMDCNISTSYTSTQSGRSVNFSATGTPAPNTHYAWNFGDGTMAYGQNVNHLYSAAGTYVACVTYTSINSNFPHDTCEAVSCDTITIQRTICNVSTAFTSARSGNTVSFYGMSTPGNYGTYIWNFGDGTYASGQNPTHTYSSAGTYNVCLTYRVSNTNYYDSCTAVYCDTIIIQKPACNVSTSFTSTQSGRTVNFVGAPTVSSSAFYLWNFGDGTTAIGKNVSHTYASSGTYYVCLTYRMVNPNYPSDTCSAQYCKSVTIQKPACNVGASFTSAPGNRNTVAFYGKSSPGVSGYYYWNFGDGSTGGGKNTIHTYSSPGVYEVCLTFVKSQPNYPNDTCMATFCDTVRVGKQCDLQAGFQDSVIGKTVYLTTYTNSTLAGLYKWNFGDGNTLSTSSPNAVHTYTNPGTYKITMDFYLLNIHGTCIASDVHKITIQQTKKNNSSISVYPMPASDKLNFQFAGEDAGGGEASVEIISSFGDVIKKQQYVDGNEIDIHDIPAGFYILRIIKNNKVYTQQFLKN